MKSNDLTEKEEAIYLFLIEYIQENGYPPSYREIAEEYRIASSLVLPVLWALESKGKIKLKPKISRAIQLTEYTFVKKQNIVWFETEERSRTIWEHLPHITII